MLMTSLGSDRLKSAGDIALECLRTTLQLTGSASSATGVPGLAAGIAGITAILDIVQAS